jgi:hypothetical protein
LNYAVILDSFVIVTQIYYNKKKKGADFLYFKKNFSGERAFENVGARLCRYRGAIAPLAAKWNQ